jgi:hypothetical protein
VGDELGELVRVVVDVLGLDVTVTVVAGGVQLDGEVLGPDGAVVGAVLLEPEPDAAPPPVLSLTRALIGSRAFFAA